MSEHLVLPFYVVADVSFSMTTPETLDGERRPPPLDTLNAAVGEIKDAIDLDPILSDKVRFALIDFADDARTQIPLCDLLRVDSADIPRLVARGATSYSAALTALRQQIDADVRQLKADGSKVHRPAVFFLTDGEPTDPNRDWQQAYSELTDASFGARPNLIPFGFGEAKKVVLDQLVYPRNRLRSYVARDGVRPSEAIRGVAELLIGSMIASANSIASDEDSGGFVPPDIEEDDRWL